MNGRLYDPVLRSFLMPDNFVQQPENTQNYNRYAYVLNNPLKYTDPSGEELISIGVAILIGAAVAALTYTITAAVSDVPFSLGGLAKATFIGAASAAVTFGIGSGAESMFTSWSSCGWAQVARSAVQAVAHGTFQGAMTGVSGGKFWNGFAAGAASSIASSLFSADLNTRNDATLGWGNSVRSSSAGMIAFGTVSGGAGAVLTGGNFWQGAVTGLVVSGLNHVAHRIRVNNYIDEKLANAGYSRSDIIGMNDAELDTFGRTVFPEMYEAGGKPEFLFNDSINGYGETRDACKSCFLGNKITIHISSKSFTTNFRLAAVIGHELIHAADYFSGRMAYWFGMGGENYALDRTEINAYNWNLGNNSLFSNYQTYKNHNSNIGWTPLSQTPYLGN